MRRRILVALRSGALYDGALELVVGGKRRERESWIAVLRAEGLVRTVLRDGVRVVELTEAGEQAAR